MLDDLLSILNISTNDVSLDVIEKFQNYLDSLKNERLQEKEDNEKQRIDLEQLVHELEERFIASSTELNRLRESQERSTKEFDSLLARAEYAEKAREVSASAEANARNETVLAEKRALSAERDLATLTDNAARRAQQLSDSQSEVVSLRQQVEEFRVQRIEARCKEEDFATRENRLIARERRLEEQRVELDTRVCQLEQQLAEKNAQLSTATSDQVAKLMCLQSDLEATQSEVERLKDALERHRNTSAELTERQESLLERLRASEEERVRSEELYLAELNQQRKLTQLYLDSSNDSQKKVEDLMSAVEELQMLLKSAADEQLLLESSKIAAQEEASAISVRCNAQISELQSKLTEANALIERLQQQELSEDEVTRLAPAAAAASRLLKQGGGAKSLTQIYSEHSKVQRQLEMERFERRQAEESLQLVIHELEAKAPALRAQREDLTRTQITCQQLHAQLESALIEMTQVRHESEESCRKSGFYERETKRLRTQVADLNAQVRALLCEVEVARGRPPVQNYQDDVNQTTPSALTSAQVISEQLVVVRDIHEMQERNQKLLLLTRELAESKEEQEKTLEAIMAEDCRGQLAELRRQMELLAKSEKRHKDMLSVTVRQRDLFKVLLLNSGSAAAVTSAVNLCSSSITAKDISDDASELMPVENLSAKDELLHDLSLRSRASYSELEKKHAETVAALRHLQDEFDFYRREKKESERMNTDTIENLRKEHTELRLQNAKLSAQMDACGERSQLAETNIKNYQAEVKLLRQMNQKYTTSVAKQEQMAVQFREEMRSANDRAITAEVQLRHLQSQLETARVNEAMSKQEVELVRRQRHGQEVLMSNLRAIQENLERRDLAEQTALQQQLSTLRRELELARCSAEREAEQAASTRHESERQQARLQAESTMHLRRAEVAEERLVVAERRLSAIALEMDEMQRRLAEAEQRSARLFNPNPNANSSQSLVGIGRCDSSSVLDTELPADEKRLLQLRVQELVAEKEALLIQVQAAREETAGYRAIATAVEERLAEQSRVSAEIQDSAETQLMKEREKSAFLSSQVEAHERERQSMMNENIRLSEESHALNAELRSNLIQAQHDLQEALSRRETALLAESEARVRVETAQCQAQDAQVKYQNELVLHAADVQALAALRKELTDLRDERLLAERQRDSALSENAAERKLAKELVQQFEQQVAQLRTHLQEKSAECRTLQEQMEQLSERALTLQRQHSLNSPLAPLELEDNAAAKSAEQLMTLLQFVRREREIAEARAEALESEAARLRHELGAVKRQLDLTKQQLHEERSRQAVQLESARAHSDLLRRVEQLDLTTESNRLLRQEQEALRSRAREAEARAQSLQASLIPLQSELGELRAELVASREASKASIEEKSRWQERCARLIEQQERTDPEMYREACAQRDAAKAELDKMSTELSGAEEQLNKRTTELAGAKAELVKVTLVKEEAEARVEQLQAINANLQHLKSVEQDKNKSLRELARRFREASRKAEEKLASGQGVAEDAREELEKARNQASIAQAQLAALETLAAALREVLPPTTTHVATPAQDSDDDENSVADTLRAAQAQFVQLRAELEAGLQEQRQLRLHLSQSEERCLRVQIIESQMKKLSQRNIDLTRDINELRFRAEKAEATIVAAEAALPCSATGAATMLMEDSVATTTVAAPSESLTTTSSAPNEPQRQTAEIAPTRQPPPQIVIATVAPTTQQPPTVLAQVVQPLQPTATVQPVQESAAATEFYGGGGGNVVIFAQASQQPSFLEDEVRHFDSPHVVEVEDNEDENDDEKDNEEDEVEEIEVQDDDDDDDDNDEFREMPHSSEEHNLVAEEQEDVELVDEAELCDESERQLFETRALCGSKRRRDDADEDSERFYKKGRMPPREGRAMFHHVNSEECPHEIDGSEDEEEGELVDDSSEKEEVDSEVDYEVEGSCPVTTSAEHEGMKDDIVYSAAEDDDEEEEEDDDVEEEVEEEVDEEEVEEDEELENSESTENDDEDKDENEEPTAASADDRYSMVRNCQVGMEMNRQTLHHSTGSLPVLSTSAEVISVSSSDDDDNVSGDASEAASVSPTAAINTTTNNNSSQMQGGAGAVSEITSTSTTITSKKAGITPIVWGAGSSGGGNASGTLSAVVPPRARRGRISVRGATPRSAAAAAASSARVKPTLQRP